MNYFVYPQEVMDRILRGEDIKEEEIMDIMSLQTTDSSFEKLTDNTKNGMLEGALKIVVNIILDSLTPELARKFILISLSKLEEITQNTENKFDDIIVRALCNKVRQILISPEVNNGDSDSVKNVVNFVQTDVDKYLNEIDFGKTDVMKALSTNVKNAFEKKELKNPFEK